MSIRPENYTLGKLLQNRLFRIPDYQRTYSWETKQRKDLFEDIQKLAENTNSDRHHFMSTVVCLQIPKREEVGADEFGIFYVVDGQQRLTTLIILLKALIKELNAGNETDKREANKLQELLVKENGRLILLQTNHDNKSLFRNYLEKGKFPDEKNVETLADSNMIRAFQECEEFVREWHLNNLSILELLKLVKNRLDFIFYVLQDEGAVHTTFEVLNSRGLAVDWLDKCKSMLMGIAYEKLDSNTSEECIGELHTCWSQIYRTIGIKQVPGQEILRFTATLEESGKSKVVGAEYAMEFFRSKCELNPKLVIEVSNKLLEITEQLESLIKNPRLKAVTKISHARLLAVAIMLNKHLNIDDKKKILEEWEKITFRIFGMSRRDARTKVGEYVCLAREIFNNQDWSVDQIIEKIQHIGKDYPASEAVKQLENTNCYEGWQEELVYLFFRYEEYLNRQLNGSISKEVWEQVWKTSPTKTIEHIHPQKITINRNQINMDLRKKWRSKFGIKTDFVERQAQRLGNLILLPPGVNSSASNKSFQEKKEIYSKHRHLKLIDEIIEKEDWNLQTMEEREKKIIRWAEKEWE